MSGDNLNVIAYALLMMAIGLVVDYCIHMALKYQEIVDRGVTDEVNFFCFLFFVFCFFFGDGTQHQSKKNET